MTDADKLAELINNHPYSKRKILTSKELKNMAKQDRPDLVFEQDFLRTLDPKTGKVPRERLFGVIENINTLNKSRRTVNFNWESRGPLQVAGRTRGVFFDPNDVNDKRVFAGGVSGGIWKNEDITDENVSWIQVEVGLPNFAISAMDYDPVVTTTFYAGTGEGWNNADATRGAGIYKSIDGGNSWTILANTTGFHEVYDLVVRNESGAQGVVYASVRISGNTDLLRSTDGGTTWTTTTTSPYRDLEIGPDNVIWAGGANGDVFNSTNGTTWNQVYTSTGSRVELAVAPSNANVVYALIASGSLIGEIIKSTDGGATWTNTTLPDDANDATVSSVDFTRGQAWYDLIAVVNPTNPNEVHVGGVNTFKTTDAGATWQKTSSWSSYWDDSVSHVHADIHNILYRPNNNSILYATDGGMFFAPDASIIPTSGVNAFTTGIFARNKNYNVTQFFSGAIDPKNTNGFLGGTQDNGTPYFDSPGIDDTSDFSGGDGGFAFIDQTAFLTSGTDGSYYIVSNTGNAYRLHDFNNTIYNIPIVSNSSNGSFINPADYDDQNNVLYSYNGGTSISQSTLKPDNTTQSSTTVNLTIADINNIVTHIRVSPYNAGNRAVFFGTITGRLIKRTNDGTTTIINNSTIGGAISCVEVGATDNELLVTYSNFGVTSVIYTSDGGVTWLNKEGNLPDMPVRWSLFNPLHMNEVILATDAGIWKTSDITATTPVWTSFSSGMGAVRVDMLQYRASDNLILAASHGRGMFTSNFTDNNVTWTGTTNNDWNIGTNWSSNALPISSQDVIIPSGLTNYPTAIDPVTVNSVTMNSGSSLIAQSTFTGTITYNRNIPTTNWHLISSPVDGQDIDAFVTNEGLAVGSTNVNNRGLGSYNNTLPGWTYYQNGAVGTGDFLKGDGKSLKLAGVGDIAFVGNMRTESETVVTFLNTTGFNLTGNPYISYVAGNNSADNTNNVLKVNTGGLTEETLWYWNQATELYEIVNQTTAAKFIAPAQGFFVKTNGLSTFKFNENMQSHQTTDTFQKSTTDGRPEIEVTLSDETNTRKTDIYYIEGTTTGFDNGYDSSIFSGAANSIIVYTRTVALDDEKNLGIQSLPNSNYEDMIIPIGIKASVGAKITLSAKGTNLPAGISIYLEDIKNNSFLLLDDTSKFTTTLESDLNGIGRFYLHTSSKTLDVSQVYLDDAVMYVSNNKLHIQGIKEGNSEVKIFDVSGKNVFMTSIQGPKEIALSNLSAGVYLVHLKTESGKLVKKVILD
ncbi:T9SS type A sorting domain-containing protein [Polaribacter sp.]|uniref:T9SS type A sorting domain-containing protein n=1 Tax=Polaribacter sp. TaxID=1920175 RepID=UPI003EF466C4